MTLQDDLNALSDDQKRIVFFIAKNKMQNRAISERLGLPEKTLEAQITDIYKALHIEGDTKDKRSILIKQVSPLLPDKLDAFLKGQPEPPKVARPPFNRNVIAGIVVVVVGILAILYWWSLHPSTPSPTPTVTIPTSAVIPQNTPLPPATLEVATTQAPQATSEPPTLAATATIPALTNTPPAFYDQGQWAPLKDGIFVRVNESFGVKDIGNCSLNGYVIILDFMGTSGKQFLLRFDPSAFHAQDDQGHDYPIAAVGGNICYPYVGPQEITFSVSERNYLFFKGNAPLTAQYLIITADSLSGVKLVFHKSF